MSSILNLIPKDRFLASPQPTAVYRLGMFNDASHDLVELFESEYYPPHYHLEAEGYLHVVLGEGIINIDGKDFNYKPGSSFFIAKGVKHGFSPKMQTLILSIQSPPVKDVHAKEDILY